MAASLDSGGQSSYVNSAASATLTFTGTDVSWLSRESPSSGIADVSIDGAKVATIDRYSSVKSFAKAVFTKSGLTDAQHSITVTWTGLKNAASTGSNLLVDAFVISTVAPVAAPIVTAPTAPAIPAPSAAAPVLTTWEETNPALVYTGSWTPQAAYWDSSGSANYATASSSVKLTFNGTDVQWISRQSPTSGISDVLIDGTRAASIDRYLSTKTYGQVVLATSGLSYGDHTIQLVWTGLKNPSATGSNILLDAFVTWTTPPPVTPEPPVATVASAGNKGLSVSWNTPSTSPVGYFVKRSTDGVNYTTIVKLPAGATSYQDISVTPGVSTTYRVTALDYKDGDIGTSAPVSSAAPAISSGTGYRYASCPAATVTVTNATELKSALWRAAAGSVIRLAPGTYSGTFSVASSGTASAPIWVCGPRTAILTSGSTSSGHAFSIENQHDVILAGFSISTAFKGVTVVNSQHISVTDLLVEKIGYEAIHFRNQTSDSEATFTTIRSTGLAGASYGEGVYVGTSDANWCAYNGCLPDRTVRTLVYGNAISNTGAQAIEAKAGTSDGVIANNTLSGTLASGQSWITVKGNQWVVADNVGAISSTSGYATNASVTGWGMNNTFTRNTAQYASGYGVWIHQPSGVPDLGNLVSCNTPVTSVTLGVTNVTCMK